MTAYRTNNPDVILKNVPQKNTWQYSSKIALAVQTLENELVDKFNQYRLTPDIALEIMRGLEFMLKRRQKILVDKYPFLELIPKQELTCDPQAAKPLQLEEMINEDI